MTPAACVGVLLCWLIPAAAWAQPPSEATPADSALVITSVRIEGNERFDDETLQVLLRTQPNRRFLGIPGFTLWRWVYQLGERGCCFSDRIARGFRRSGEPLAVLNAATLAADAQRLQRFYRQEGYRRATVAAEVDTTRRRQVRVTFRIAPGEPTYLRRVAYPDLADWPADRREAFLRQSLLSPVRARDTDSLALTLFNQRFSEVDLLAERGRMVRFLRDEGYAAVTRDSVRAVVRTPRPDSFDVAFRVARGPRYRIGDVQFVVLGPEDTAPRHDTLVLADSARVPVVIDGDRQLETGLLRRALRLTPGAWYRESDVAATKRRLEATGLFAFTDLVAGTPPDSAALLPITVELRTRPRHQLRLEGFLLQRQGGLGAGSEEVGLGTGASYTNLNWLGQGEVLQLRTSGSVAADFDRDLFTTAQAEVGLTIAYPYLFGPFRRLERALDLYDARTRMSVSLLTARREELKLIIRGRVSAQFRLEMQHTPSLTSSVDLLDFQLSDPDTLSGFTGRFLRFVTDPVDSLRIVTDYNAPLINNALRYTLRSATANPLRRDRGHLFEGAIELGGNLPYLLDRFVFTPDSVEGSLPRLPLFASDSGTDELVYRQYVRGQVDLRQYVPVRRGTLVAWKFVGGWAHPIGRSDVVPFDRRFYAGGASSVRGWRLRSLGPGTSADPDDRVQGGDIKLEGSVEVRTLLFREIVGANWLVAGFVDAGNVWFGPRNPGGQAGRLTSDFLGEFGVGGGGGLRLDWRVLIVRLDLAYRLHDPVDGSFPGGRPVLHFGIGHAF